MDWFLLFGFSFLINLLLLWVYFALLERLSWKSFYFYFFVQTTAVLKNTPTSKVIQKIKLIIEYLSRPATFPAAQLDALWERNASIFPLPTHLSRPMLLLSVLRVMVVFSYKFSSLSTLLTSGFAPFWRLLDGPRGAISSWLMVVQGKKKKIMGVIGRTKNLPMKYTRVLGSLGDQSSKEYSH